MNTLLTQTERKNANNYLNQFRKTKERGEFRNKIGRIFWPIFNRLITYGIPVMAGLAIAGGAAVIPATAVAIGMWTGGRYITKGLSVNLQNIALKNASVLGYQMVRDKIPDDTRKYIMEQYLNKTGAWVFNKQYLKKNPTAIDSLKDGKPVQGVKHLVTILERNANQLVNTAQKNGNTIRFTDRLKMYQKTWNDYKRPTPLDRPIGNKQINATSLQESKTTGKLDSRILQQLKSKGPSSI